MKSKTQYYVCGESSVILGVIGHDGRTTVSNLTHKQVLARYPHAVIMSSADATKAAINALVSKDKLLISVGDYDRIRNSDVRKTFELDATNQETIKLLDTIVDDVTTVFAKTKDGCFQWTDRLEVPHRTLVQKLAGMPIRAN
jgi:bifunctional N-acetylglucosamine-1-phosphate-uridyltransferase/glucosamine-1-phosphate-acetyltransferase GlmU-like protein